MIIKQTQVAASNFVCGQSWSAQGYDERGTCPRRVVEAFIGRAVE